MGPIACESSRPIFICTIMIRYSVVYEENECFVHCRVFVDSVNQMSIINIPKTELGDKSVPGEWRLMLQLNIETRFKPNAKCRCLGIIRM